jgi:PKD repeat protein
MHWSFGDGATDSIANPAHIYSAGGNYSAALIIYNSSGCSDTATNSVTIESSPLPAFSFTHTCTNESTIFSNLTDSGGLAGVTYLWDFGDGQNSTSTNPLHLFASQRNINGNGFQQLHGFNFIKC